MASKLQPHYKPGEMIGGRYWVYQALMGGMGEVYLCLDHVTNLPFALKTFPRHYLADLEKRRIFEAEVLTWVALEDHPNIVRCYTMDVVDNQPFMFLEWIANEDGNDASLRSRLYLGALELRLALEFTIDICRGLIHAQEKQPGLIHRDLKPENILIARGEVAKVSDFGLAQVIQVADVAIESANISTENNPIVQRKVNGTPAYMAPEQWRDESLDLRTDIYAIGCILYELLTGQLPYRSAALKLSEQHFFAPIPQLPSNYPNAVAQLNEVLLYSLAKRKEDRFATFEDLLNELTIIYRNQFVTSPRIFAGRDKFNALDYGNRATAYVRLKRYPEALADFNTLIQLDPFLADAYCDRGGVYVQLRRYDDALVDFNHAISLKPDDAATYVNRGIVYNKLQRYDAALADYGKAIQIEPRHTLSYLNRTNTFLDLQRYDDALADLNWLIQLNQNFAAAYHQRAKVHSSLARFMDALKDYNHAIQLDPTLPNVLFERGYIHGILSNYVDAVQDFGMAIEADPQNVLAVHMLGYAFERMGQNVQALQQYDRAVTFDPTHVQTFFQRGRVLERMERFKEALADYTTAVKLRPDASEYYLRRGIAYAKLEKYEDAVTDFTSVLELSPSDLSTYILRGNCYTQIGNYQNAIADYQKAIALDPNCGLAYFNIGALLSNYGQLHEALSFLEKAEQLGEPLASPALAQVRQVLGN